MLEGRRKEGARRVAQMMLAEKQLAVVEIGIDRAQFAHEKIFLKELLAKPKRHRHQELPKAARRNGKIGFKQPLELEEWLLVEDHRIDVGEIRLALAQAVLDGIPRECCVMLAPRESLLLRRGHDPSIDHQGSGTIVIVGRNAKNAHESACEGCC